MWHGTAWAQTIPPQFSDLRDDSSDLTPIRVPALPSEPRNGTAPTSANKVEDGLRQTIVRIGRPPDGNCPSSKNPAALCHGTTWGGGAAPDNAGGLAPEYAKLTAWNTDGSLLLLLQSTGSRWHIYDGTNYKWIRLLSEDGSKNGFACHPTNGVMWSNTIPGRIYYFTNCGGKMQLRRLDLGSAPYAPPYADTLVHAFAPAGHYPNPLIGAAIPPDVIECGEECNLSDDDQWIAFMMWCSNGAKCRKSDGNHAVEIGAYNLRTNATYQLPINFPGCQGPSQCFAPHTCLAGMGCPYAFENGTIDNISMSPSGKYVMLANIQGSSICSRIPAHPGAGIESWRNDLSFVGMGSCNGGSHHDVTYDVQGNEVMVGFWNGLLQADGRTLKSALMSDPAKQSGALLPASYPPSGYHISCRTHTGAAKGWCLLSMWNPNSGEASFTKGWGTAENVAVLVSNAAPYLPAVLPAVFRRVNLNYSMRHDDYFAESHATTNTDFTKIVFGSNWGVDHGPVFPFVVELGKSRQRNGSGSPTPANGNPTGP